MKNIIDDFLASQQMMQAGDFGQLMGWSEETLSQKIARRETPAALRVKRLVLFRYGAIAAWLEEHGEELSPKTAEAVKDTLLR